MQDQAAWIVIMGRLRVRAPAAELACPKGSNVCRVLLNSKTRAGQGLSP